MAERNQIIELVPHYLAMLVLIFLVLAGVRVTVGEVGFWIELLLVIAVALGYPALVRQLDVAPSMWESGNE